MGAQDCALISSFKVLSSIMAGGLLCFVWDEVGSITLRRESPAFLREFPAGFEADVHLRPPRRPGASNMTPVPLFLCRHASSCASSGSNHQQVLPELGATPA